jgi:hypothetical protein
MESQWVSVINQTRGTTLGRRVQKADSFWTRAKGLLGRRGLSPGEGLLIYPCRGIHSFGMRFAFDAIYLDQDYVVLHMIEQMAANRRGPLFKRARAVLELPFGTIAATATQVGDRLVVR